MKPVSPRGGTAFAGAKLNWAWLLAAVLLPAAAWGQTISFLPLATSFTENATNAVVTIIRSPVTGVASVNYTTTNGTATAGPLGDYLAVSGTLSFANGEGSKTVLIPILEDLVAEAPETFFFVLSSPSGATLATNVLALTIQDNDTFFQFSAPTYAVNEGQTNALVTVFRVGGAPGPASVDLFTTDITAVSGLDYTNVFVSLPFAVGQTQATVSIPLIDVADGIPEGVETFRVSLTNAVGAVISGGSATVSITDNDGPGGTVGFQFAVAQVVEGSNIVINVLRTGPTALTVAVDVVVLNPNPATRTSPVLTVSTNAIQGTDYTLSDRTGVVPFVTLIWANGQGGAQSFTLDALNDTAVEAFETVLLGLQTTSTTNFGPVIDVPRSVMRVDIDFNQQPPGAADRAYNVNSVFNPNAGANNAVYAAAAYTDPASTNFGKAIVVGDFTAVNAIARGRIARLNADGTLDLTFNPGTGADAFVNAVAIQSDGKIIVAGGFNAMNSVGRAGVARLNHDGSLDNTFTPGLGADGIVTAMALQADGTILLAGEFTHFNNFVRNRLVRLGTNGAVDAAFDAGAGPNGSIYAISLPTAGNTTVPISASASGSGSDTNVINLGVNQGTMNLAFNAFSIADNVRVYYDGVLLLDSTFTSATNFSIPFGPGTNTSITLIVNEGLISPGTVWTYTGNVAISGSSVQLIYVGGDFTSVAGSPRSRVARLLPSGAVDTAFAPSSGPNNTVFSLLASPASLLVGGAFNAYDGTPRGGIARVNTDGSLDATFYPGSGVVGSVYTIAAQTNGQPIIGGEFTSFNGTPRTNIARLYNNGVLDTSFLEKFYNQTAPGPNGFVNTAVLMPTGNVLIGGGFSLVGGGFTAAEVLPRYNFAQLIGGDILPARNMAGNVIFTAAGFSVDENAVNSAVAISLQRINGELGQVVVTYATEDGTGLAGTDYTATTGSLTWADSDQVVGRTIFVPILDNGTPEGNRTFTVRLTGISSGGWGTQPALGFQDATTITIVDNDFTPGVLGFSAPFYRVVENVGNATVTVTRTNGTVGSVSAQYATSPGTATPGNDYSSRSGTLTFASGQASRTFTVPILNDTGVEFEESIILTLSNPAGGATLGLTNALILIESDEAGAGSLSFQTNQFLALEATGQASITVLRTSGSVGAVSVNLLTYELPAASSGVARAGLDYTTVSTNLTFAAGVTSLTVAVPLTVDRLVEGAETFGVRLTNVVGGANLGTLADVRVVIQDANAFGSLSFSATNYVVSEATNTATVTVVRTGGDTDAVSVQYFTTPGTAVVGADFLLTNGTLVFPDTVTTGLIRVPILDDVVLDGSKTFSLTLSNFVKAGVGPITNTVVTINDDEAVAAPAGSVDTRFDTSAVTSGSVNAIAVQSGSQLIVGGAFTSLVGIPVQRIARVTDDGTVDLTFRSGTGANEVINTIVVQPDQKLLIGGAFTTYNAVGRPAVARLNADGSLDTSFNPGSGPDNAVNSLAVGSGGRIYVAGAFSTFNGVSRPGLVALTAIGTVDPGFTTGSGVAGKVFVVAVQADGKVLIGGDFTVVNNTNRGRIARLNTDGSLDSTFMAAVVGADAPVRAIVVQPDGKIVIGGSFLTVNGVARGGVARLNPDGSLDAGFMADGVGADAVVLAMALQPDGRIVATGDFLRYRNVTRSRVVRLSADGSVDPTLNIGTGADGVVGAVALQVDEKIVVGGSFTRFDGLARQNLTRLVGGANAGAGAFVFESPVFNASESSTNATILVRRTLGLAGAVTVNFAAVAGTAGAGDFGLTNGVLSFPDNEVFASFTVSLTNTALVEGDRTVLLASFAPTGGASLGSVSNATLVIIEDDSAIGFSTASYSVSENVPGGLGAVSVIRTGNLNSTVSVLALTGTTGTATPGAVGTPGADYAPTNATLVFAPGVSSLLFLVPILDDLVAEGDDTVALLLTNFTATGTATALGLAGRTTASLLIVDNEFGPGAFVFATNSASISESGGAISVTVSRLNGSSGVATVRFITADGTATAGLDYVATNGVLTFASGDLTKIFLINVLPDTLVEGDETVRISLANATGGATVQQTNDFILNILDDDSQLSFSAATYFVAEDASTVTIPVRRTGGTNTTVNFTLATADGTGGAGLDYTGVVTNLTLLPGATNLDFLITVLDDALLEGDETFTLSLSNGVAVPTGLVTFGISNATVTVVDNEIVLAFSAANYSVAESLGRLTINVVRSGVATQAVSVSFVTTNGTALAGLDYFATNGVLNFAPGVTNQSFDVRVADNLFVNSVKTLGVSLLNPVGPLGVRLAAPTNAVVSILEDDLTSPAAGTVDVTFRANLGADGPIYAVAFHTNGQLFLGGNFTTVNGGLVNRVARLNADGTLDQNFNPGLGADTNVYAVVVQPDGAVLLGGQFTSVNGTARARVARLSVIGAVDITFNPGTGADADVYALAVQPDGAVLVGGAFANFNGVSAGRVVRLAVDGSVDATFSTGSGANGPVRSIAVLVDGRIVIAGDFTSFNGVSAPRITRLNANGAVDVTFNAGAGADNTIYSLAASTNGSVVVAGAFTTFGGLTKNGITRINLDGTLDASFNSGLGANGTVLSVSQRQNGRVMLAGTFTAVNGVSRNRFARLNADGSLDAAFDPGTGANNVVNAVSVFQPPQPVPQPFAVTSLFSLGGQTNVFDIGATSGVVNVTFNAGFSSDTFRLYYQGVRLLDTNFFGSQTFSVPYGPGTSTVVTITVNEGAFFFPTWDYAGTLTPVVNTSERVVIAGDFTTVNGVPRARVAQLNENGAMDTTFGLGTGSSIVLGVGLNTNLALPDLLGKSVVGGNFTALNGANVSRLARLNLDGSLDLAFNTGTGADATINAVLVQPDGRVIIGGFFTNFNGTGRGRLARLNSNGSLDTGFDTTLGANNIVLALALQPDGKVLVGGLFTTLNGTARNFIARLNADGTVDSSFNTSVGADGAVRAIAVQADGKVLIGGDFSTVNGAARSRIARLNADGTLDTLAAFNAGVGFNDFVSALALDASQRIIVGGAFTTANGLARNRIARLTTAGAVDVAFDPGAGFDDYVNAAVVQPDGKLVLVGGFTTFNGLLANRIIRLTPDGSVDTAINFGLGANNFVSAAALQPWDEKILIGGAFSAVDGQTRNGVARLNAGANGAGAGTFEFTVPNYLAAEDATNATIITVVRRNGLTGTATVQLGTSDGTAVEGLDYVGLTNTLTFVNAQNSTDVIIRLLDNQVANPNKTVVLTLFNPSPGAGLGAVNPAIITIVDNDSLLEFSAGTFSVNESSSNATITVVRNGGGSGAVSVTYTTTGGSATAGLDFISVSNQLFWATGDVAPKTFDVPILPDSAVEGNETVVLNLSAPGGAASLGRATAVLTIVDDDFSPGVLGFVTNLFVVTENVGLAVITVVRTNGSTGPVSVQFSTANGSAVSGLDYTLVSGFLNFSDGQTNKTFSVPVLQDLLPEGDESVVLTLSNPGNGAGLGLASAVLLIRDDEISNGIIGFSAPTYSVTESAGAATITVIRTNGSQGTVTANFTTSDGTAKQGTDYTTTSGTLIFPDAVTNVTFNIPILDDPLIEPTEVVNLTLSTPTGGALLGLANAVLTIVDDDYSAGTFTFTATNYMVKDTETVNTHYFEDSTASSIAWGTFIDSPNGILYSNRHHNIPGALITVTRSGGADGVVSVDFSTRVRTNFFNLTNGVIVGTNFFFNPDAQEGVDFLPTNGTLTFMEHEMSKSFVVPIVFNFANRFTNFGVGTLGFLYRSFDVVLTNAVGGASLGVATNSEVFIESPVDFSSLTYHWSRKVYRVREDIGVANFFLFGPRAAPLGISFSNPNAGTNLWSLQSFFGTRSIFFGVGTLPAFGNYLAHQAGSDWASSGGFAGGSPTGDFDGSSQGISHGGGVDVVSVPIFDDLIAEFNEDFTMRVRGGEDECTVTILDNDDAPGIFDRDYNPDFDDRTIPPQNSAPGANNTVFATAVQEDGKALVGGVFTAVNTLPRSRIARMNLDGSLDTSFRPGVGANEFVAAIGTYPTVTNTIVTFDTNGVPLGTNFVSGTNNGKILLGGGFSSYNGTARNFIARVDTNGTLDATFNPGIGANAAVRALLVYTNGALNGRALIAGDFTSYNGTNRNHVARIRVDGGLDISFNPGTGANGPIYAMRLQKDGKVVVGGDFTTFNGVPRNRVARLTATGALDLSFNPSAGADGAVYALGLEDSLPAVINGTAISTNINRNASGGPAQDVFDLVIPTPAGTPTGALYQGVLTINYDFLQVPDTMFVYLGANQLPVNRIYSSGLTNGVATVAINFGPSTNDTLRIVMNEGSGLFGTIWSYDLSLVAVVSSTPQPVPAGPQKIILGGEFNNFDLRRRNKVARLNADGTLDTSFAPGSGFNDTVFAIAMTAQSQAVVGGQFTDFNSTRRVGLARLLQNGTLDTTFMDSAYNQFAGLINLSNTLPRNFVAAIAIQPATNTITVGNGTNSTVITDITEEFIIGGSFQQGGGGNRDSANSVAPGFSSPNGPTRRVMAGFDRSDKLAQPGVFPRADIRKRSNFARVKGGVTRGAGNIDFTQPNYTLDENGGSLFITLARTNGTLVTVSYTNGEPPIGPASVNFGTVDPPFGPGAGSAGQDYVTSRRTPTWALVGPRPADGFTGPNNVLRGVTDVFVAVTEDFALEGDELVDLVLSKPQGNLFLAGERIPTGVALGVSRAALTIVDNDFNPGVLTFPQPVFRVDENIGMAVVTVIRTNGSTGPISCDYATTIVGSTATVGVDYVATSGSIAFAAGQLTNTFTVPLVDDAAVELDETIAVQLFNPRGGVTLGLSNAVILIIDNDFTAGRLNFSQPIYSVAENAGTAEITVLRSGGSLGALTVQVAVTNGTAVSPADYTAATNTLVWAATDTTNKTFTVTLADNLNVDGNRTVNLALFNPTIAGALGTITNAVLTIVDDDAFGSLAFSRPSYSVNENGSQAIVTVVRLGGVAGTVSVRYDTVAGGTAVAGSNYVTAGGTLSLVPGQTSTNFIVTVLDNTVSTGTRTVNLALTGPVGATLGFPSTATLSIIDDESVNVVAGSTDTTYTSAGADSAIYAMALQPDGYLLVGGDFTAVNGVSRNRLARLDAVGALDPVFNPGGANGSIRNILVYDRGLNTGRILVSGFFTQVSSTNRSRIARLNQSGSVDLTFDPGAGADNAIYAVALQPDDRVIVGGGFSTFNGIGRNFIARLNANGTLDNTFDPGTGANGPVFSVAVQPDGKVLIGGDFTTVNGLAFTNLARLNADGSVDPSFAVGSGANNTVRSLLVQTDGKILMAGSFTSYAGNPVGGVARLHATGLLDASFNSGGLGANNAVFYLTVQGDGKMLLGGDFTQFNGVSRNRFTRLNPDGTTDPTLNVGTGANNFVAAIAVQTDEKILVAGGFTTFNSQPRNYLARLNGGVIAGAGSVEFITANYTVAENAGSALITVRRVGGTTGAASVFFSCADGTATTNGVHYTNVSATLNFPEGETFVTTNINIVDDAAVNADRFVNLSLSDFRINGVSSTAIVGGQTNALLTIINDDGRLGFSAATYNVSEVVGSGSATLTVTRTGGTTAPAAVQFFTTTNGTATPNVDFVPVSGTLLFAAGETFKNFSLPIIDDILLEGNETIELVLTNLTGNAVPGQMTAILTIVDNDVAPGVLNFAQANYVTNESDTIVLAQITILRTNGSTGVVSVDYRTGNAIAIAGQDYLSSIGTLSFADGETVKVFTVPILPDSISETNETVFLDLLNATGGATIGFQSSAILTILNNDILIHGNLVFSSAAYTNSESSGAATITVRRIGGTQGDIGVAFATTTNGTAVAGLHYTPVSGSLFWPSGDASVRTFTVPLFNTSLVDGDRTVSLALSNATNGASLNLPSTATLTIQDDDTAPGEVGFASVVFNAQESATNALITVSRTNGFTGTVSVQYATYTNLNDLAVAYSGFGLLLPIHHYTNTTGTLTFTNGVTNLSFTVPLIDNALQDGNRTFSVRLFGETGGALLALSNTVVRIVDNENNAGSVDTGYITGLGANGTVNSIQLATNGQAIVAGAFTTFDTVARQNAARLNIDGSVDNGFDPGIITFLLTNSIGVTARALNSNTVVTLTTPAPHGLVVGTNINVAGLNRSFMNGAGIPVASVPTPTNLTFSVAPVTAVVVSVSRVNATGIATLNTVGPHQLGTGDTVTIAGLTNLLFNGTFVVTSVPNAVTFTFAQAGPDDPGTPDVGNVLLNTVPAAGTGGTVVHTHDVGTVRAIGVYTNGINANKVVIGGRFSIVGNALRANIARLNTDGTPDPTFNPGAGANNAVNAVAIQNGRVLLGGSFTTVNNTNRNFIARLNFDGTLDTTFDPGAGPDGPVRAIVALNDGSTLIAGDFDTVAGVTNRRIARLTANGVLDPTFLGGRVLTNGSVFSLAVQVSGHILVGGMFASPVGGSRGHLLRLNSDGSLDTSYNIGTGPDDFVSAIAVQVDGRVLVGGAFVDFNGFSRNRIVRLNADATVDPTINFGTGADNLVAALATQVDGRILVGGAFTNFNGLVQNRFTRLHGGQNTGAGLVVFGATGFVVSEAGTNAVITVRRTGGLTGLVRVDYGVQPGGTAVAGVDFTNVSGTLTFNSGESVQSFLVPVINDSVVKPDRTVLLTLTNVTGGASLDIQPTVTLTIAENDSLIAFSAPTYTATEDTQNAVITVARTGGTNELVTVDYVTAAGSATPGLDYANVVGRVTLQAGSATATFTIPIFEDALVEGTEFVRIQLLNASPTNVASLGTLTNAVLFIVDNDFAPGVIGFSAPTYLVSENQGVAVIPVIRTNGATGSASVNYATANGTARAGAGNDYLSVAGTLVFADGEVVKTFLVPLVNDGLLDGNKTVLLSLANVGGATLGASNAVLTIGDSGPLGVDIGFANTNAITINDNTQATPYPAVIGVSNVFGVVTKLVVTLSNLVHTAPGDVDILLVGPLGQSVLLLSDAGGNSAVSGVTLRFDDAALAPVPQAGLMTSGTYLPTDYLPAETFVGPAPAGPYGTNLTAFNSLDPNGNWQLFVRDDTAGGAGVLVDGWRLDFTTVTAPGTNDLSVIISDSQDPAQPNTTLSYTVTVFNNGPAVANNVAVFNTLPAGVVFEGASLSQGSFTNLNGLLVCDLGIITNGRTATLRVDVRPIALGVIANSATVLAGEVDLNFANNTATETTVVGNLQAGLFITPNTDPTALGNAIISTNSNGLRVTRTSIQAQTQFGGATSSGTYVVGAPPVPYNLPSSGIVLSTGDVRDYGSGANLQQGRSTVYGASATPAQESILDPITGGGTNNFPHFDVTQLDVTFDVLPEFDRVTFQVVFGSEEFPEYVNSSFVDGFGILLNGVNQAFVNGGAVNVKHPSMVAMAGTELDGVLAPGGNAVLTFSIPVLPGSSNNVLTFIIADTTDQALDTTVYIAALGASSTRADLDLKVLATPEPAVIGGTITYSVNVQNLGPDAATNVVVTNFVPAGLSLTSVLPSQGTVNQANGVLTFNLGTILSGQTAVLTIVGTPTVLNKLTNTFGGISAAQDTLPGNNLASVISTVVDPGSVFNLQPIAIADAAPAVTYPSTITVTNVPGTVTQVTVTLDGLNHTFPSDLDILLVGPGGQSVLLMSDVGGGAAINGVVLKFDDLALNSLTTNGPIATGTYRPSNVGAGDFFPAPAPAAGYGSALSVFNGTNPNGDWKLFIVDDQGSDVGTLVGGWRLSILTAPAPAVQTAFTGGVFTITWPLVPAGFGLEASTLAGPVPVWTPVTPGPVTVGPNNSVSITNPPGSLFYRLRRP
ncbi:MAG: hypothetical protein RL514_1099 [Verrucomicrobiota bacterium]